MDLNRFQTLDMILVCGLHGSGKSYFAKEHFGSSDRLRVNRAEIRKLLYEMMHFGSPWQSSLYHEEDEFLVKHTERKIIEQMLQTNKRVLIDNTSVTRESRKRYLEIAAHFKKTAGVIFLNTPLARCIERNQKSSYPVPGTVIANLSLRIELPDRSEGFKEFITLTESQS